MSIPNLYLPFSPEDQGWTCQLVDCEQPASSWCHPQGSLTLRIALCAEHREQAQQQEEAVRELRSQAGDGDDPADHHSPEHQAPRRTSRMTQQQASSYDLGQHVLDLGAADAPVTIANEAVALQLAQEEAYRLYLALQEHFRESGHQTEKGR